MTFPVHLGNFSSAQGQSLPTFLCVLPVLCSCHSTDTAQPCQQLPKSQGMCFGLYSVLLWNLSELSFLLLLNAVFLSPDFLSTYVVAAAHSFWVPLLPVPPVMTFLGLFLWVSYLCVRSSHRHVFYFIASAIIWFWWLSNKNPKLDLSSGSWLAGFWVVPISEKNHLWCLISPS